MIIEQIEHATEKENLIVINQSDVDLFCVTQWINGFNQIYQTRLYKSKEQAKHYAEQLAGLIN